MSALNSPALDSSTIGPTSRQPSSLNDRLDRRLLTYMAAAGAAGVSVLAMTQPAAAKVIYTPFDGSVMTLDDGRLDLNHDGIPDFGFVQTGLGTQFAYKVIPVKFNKMMNQAAPLAAGVTVGPEESFRAGAQEMVNFCICSGSFGSVGPWADKQNEYMGFEFNIKGAAHFGWARFSVTDVYFDGVTLTGYAYETISLKPIVTGDTGRNNNNDEEDSVDQPEPAAASQQPFGLGKLALGAQARAAH
jgi:hypothetical protein